MEKEKPIPVREQERTAYVLPSTIECIEAYCIIYFTDTIGHFATISECFDNAIERLDDLIALPGKTGEEFGKTGEEFGKTIEAPDDLVEKGKTLKTMKKLFLTLWSGLKTDINHPRSKVQG